MPLQKFASLRNEGFFNRFYDTTVKKAREYNFGKDPSNTPTDTPNAYFRGIYYEAIDSIVPAVETRFNQLSCSVYEVMGNVLLKLFNKEDASVEHYFLKNTYTDDIDTTQFQIKSDALAVMSPNEKAKCFDDIIT